MLIFHNFSPLFDALWHHPILTLDALICDAFNLTSKFPLLSAFFLAFFNFFHFIVDQFSNCTVFDELIELFLGWRFIKHDLFTHLLAQFMTFFFLQFLLICRHCDQIVFKRRNLVNIFVLSTFYLVFSSAIHLLLNFSKLLIIKAKKFK